MGMVNRNGKSPFAGDFPAKSFKVNTLVVKI